MVAGGIGYLVAAASFWNWISSLQPDRTITVSGDGRAVLKPDIALISFSVVSEGKDITAMQDDNNQKINKAIELVKGLGVSKDDIKTSGYHLSPRYEYNKERQRSFASLLTCWAICLKISQSWRVSQAGSCAGVKGWKKECRSVQVRSYFSYQCAVGKTMSE